MYIVHRSTPSIHGAKSVPILRISDVGLASLKPSDRHVDYWDKTLPTFGVRVSPKGTRTFILKMHNGRQSIGRYPVISLAEARTAAKRMLAEKTLGRVKPASITFSQAVSLFIDEKTKSRRLTTASQYRWFLDRLGFAGHVAGITPSDLSRALNRIKSPSTNDHVLIAARIFFNWCIKRGYIEKNPTAGLSPHSQKSRSRILSDEELQSIWRACEQRSAVGASPVRHSSMDEAEDRRTLPATFVRIVQLLILTGQRRNEIASLKSDYIDLDNKTICLPSSLTKNKREHKFPIGDLTVSILAPLPNSPGLLFPARGNSATPFNGWSKSKTLLDRLSGVTAWTLHDLRRTYATNLAKLGVPIHIIERLLNHVSGSFAGIVSVYQRHQYLDEMRAAMDIWESYLTSNLSSP